MKRAIVVFLMLAAAACRDVGSLGGGSGRRSVRVAAASDLNAALGELAKRFAQSTNIDVATSFGSSGTFFAQLMNEAPFDIFLSADVDYPRRLAQRGLIVPDSQFTYAVGRLVLWSRTSSPVDVTHGLSALADRSVSRIAIANPEHAPYGRAAVAALKKAGVYDAVNGKLVLGENVAQALQFAQSGAADAGIVAMSLALAPGARGQGRSFDLPPDAYPRMEQGGAILRWARDLDAARSFRTFMISADARAILQQFGFGLPEH